MENMINKENLFFDFVIGKFCILRLVSDKVIVVDMNK